MSNFDNIKKMAILEIMDAVEQGYYTEKEDITNPNIAEVIGDWLGIYIAPEVINDWDLYESNTAVKAVSEAFKTVEKILNLK